MSKFLERTVARSLVSGMAVVNRSSFRFRPHGPEGQPYRPKAEDVDISLSLNATWNQQEIPATFPPNG